MHCASVRGDSRFDLELLDMEFLDQ